MTFAQSSHKTINGDAKKARVQEKERNTAREQALDEKRATD